MFPYVLLLAVLARGCSSQDDTGPYRGKYIGKLNSYHHQVSGEVYAVDEWTLLLVDFNYDGTGDDTYFWAGDSGRPGPLGFIVPDQRGTTNVLERYNNEEVRLRLPDGKRVARVAWLAVYDLAAQSAFGDVYVPDEFEAPAERTLTPLVAAPGARLASGPVRFVDAATLVIPDFRYDGAGDEVYFWTGVGPQPSSRGLKVPDEDGYLEPLRAYSGEDVRLTLPGGRTAFEVDWLAVYDVRARASLAAVLVPDALNVPPAPVRARARRATLPRCRQLHRDFQVSWEVFGGQVTLQLAARLGDDEYMAFGVSGSSTSSQMLGADVAVAWFDARLQRGLATDYNVTAVAPCVQVLGRWQGVCRDERVGGLDSNQVFSASREDGLTVVSYRRSLQPAEDADREWPLDRAVFVVWAVGALDHAREPAFHRLWPRADVQLVLGGAAADDDCVDFAPAPRRAPAAWERAQLFDPALRVFRAALGPAGGARGMAARGPAPARAWYVNGQLAPDLQLRRGLGYTFLVAGGADPHSAALYHPLVLTAEPHGGLERLADAEQRAVRVLAGARATRRGRLSPTAAGALCAAELAPGHDPRRDSFDTFRAFNRSLVWRCAGAPATLTVTPNSSWPDRVYYHSFTHADMGGRIFVVDRHRRNVARSAAPPPAAVSLAPLLLLAAVSLALRR
ncbi:protein Skeletor, isoforms B/C [Bicyclus anynana]|uniref:Protein Skeletor, isoforms B/C n=1 Tax=Bicyclus anynana TaxID=110368 RepID=A0A6J1N8S1_BICAN|nr:protein Skeletor, isoforms B/C [Bicyclus anynana]